MELVFANTGLEYPEIQKFVKYFAQWLRDTYRIPIKLTILRPEKTFKEVITEYGYPVISKEIAKWVYYYKKGSPWAVNRSKGLSFKGDRVDDYAKSYTRYNYLLDAPFNCSGMCCDVMKKNPLRHYEKSSGRRFMLATMAEESKIRALGWMKTGCNAFSAEHPMSKPMSFWTNQDVLQYLKTTGIPYAPVYGDIAEKESQTSLFNDTGEKKLVTTGCDRTGCMFCMFGITTEKEPNRFQRMKITHPKQYEYCIHGGHYEGGILVPDEHGLGLGKILDYIGRKY